MCVGGGVSDWQPSWGNRICCHLTVLIITFIMTVVAVMQPDGSCTDLD